MLEPYSRSWTSDWKYPVAKKVVAARLEKDLGFLSGALKNHADNAELFLLTGLVAHYAYNVDVPSSLEKAKGALAEAGKLASSDVRAGWFGASLLCQTTGPQEGALAFLAIEDGHAWNQLPAAFWDDYMECASVTGMPAHVLRAADHAVQLHAPSSQTRDSLADIARKRFDPYNPKREYLPKEVWSGGGSKDEPELTGTSCGARMHVRGDWAIKELGLGNATCVAYFSSGPYKATTKDLHPSILMLVKPAAENQTLEDFLALFAKNGTFEPFALSRCPAKRCIAMKGMQPGMYKADGDGHGRLVVFERDQPEFPGLIFESPMEIPKDGSGSGATVFRANQVQERMPGKLYYLVLLDTAASIEEPAMKDFDFFMQNLTVE
jgi:hypothetical protein